MFECLHRFVAALYIDVSMQTFCSQQQFIMQTTGASRNQTEVTQGWGDWLSKSLPCSTSLVGFLGST